MPIRMAKTGPPMTGNDFPRNHAGMEMARHSRRPAPFFFKKFIIKSPLQNDVLLFLFPEIQYHKKYIKG
ncbi:hypothetical protein RUMTOR_00026 [[Ruminococcus] torques ATCC 27756]|uniref:Uncharacterized protein n=1 Tax=[Ruminococcus] torques ATCC 27756 TaxID=411460 RepID=A5KII2_9FIRM|nr:hypothetical protein RUMTOR_00026 [[Ruminococcus] torques ATCC 27756]